MLQPGSSQAVFCFLCSQFSHLIVLRGTWNRYWFGALYPSSCICTRDWT